MALIGFEGWDNWSTGPVNQFAVTPFTTGLGAASGGIWVGAGTLTLTPGLLGGFAIVMNHNGDLANLTYTSPLARSIVGFRFTNATHAATVDIFRWQDGASIQCGLSVNTAGKLIFWRGTNATILATGTTVLVVGAVNYISIDTTINNTTGAFEVRLDGVTELSGSGVNTRTSANNQMTGFTLLGANNFVNTFDDLYAVDTTGPSPYNTFLETSTNPVRVETLFGTSNDSVTFTPLASTNVSQIQEVAFDSDTTYNSSITTGQIDTFVHGSLSDNPVTIFAADVCCYARKTDVTAQNFRTKLKSGATTADGATNVLSTVYQSSRTSYETDPNTGLAWGAAGVNNSKIGYEHV